jgi:hypothetical protein
MAGVGVAARRDIPFTDEHRHIIDHTGEWEGLGGAVAAVRGNWGIVVPPRAGGAAGRTYDVAPDGRFLLIKEEQAITGGVEIVFVQHWLEELGLPSREGTHDAARAGQVHQSRAHTGHQRGSGNSRRSTRWVGTYRQTRVKAVSEPSQAIGGRNVCGWVSSKPYT